MCGVTGILYFDSSRPVDSQLLMRMRDALRHRGPDDAGLWVEGSVGLGHCRLSVIDLAGGRQPMGNEMKGIWLSYNGEIYNFGSLRRTLEDKGYGFRTRGDTEVLLRAYEEYGTSVATYLEGMFAIAIWDSQKQRLFLSRDRFGIKPLYYSVQTWGLVFSSEMRSLLIHPLISQELDYRALGLYLQTEYIPAPWSLIRGIRKLKAGHNLIVENGHVRIESYWDLGRVKPLLNVDEQEAVEKVEYFLRKSVESMLVSDVPLGIFLSGGLDSSSIVRMACYSSSRRIRTFSVAFDDPDVDESPYAQDVARYFRTEHQELSMTGNDVLDSVHRVLDHMDEPLADASVLPTYLLCEAARRHVTVALSGDGGDELFAGYATHKAYQISKHQCLPLAWGFSFLEKMAEMLPASDAHLSLDFKIKKFLRAMHLPPLSRNFLWRGAYDAPSLRRILSADVFNAAGPVDLESLRDEYACLAGRETDLNRVLLWDLKFYLQDDLLPKVDRMSMAHSLEVRVPFLDTHLVEYVTSLPASLKLRCFQSKYILRKVLNGKLPKKILYRKKSGFNVPLGRWLKRELRDLVNEYLQPERIESAGIFNAREVSKLVQEHRKGTVNHRQKIWPLIVFEAWRRKFLS